MLAPGERGCDGCTVTGMRFIYVVLVAISGLALTMGCAERKAPARNSDAAVKESLAHGIAQIRSTHDVKKLHAELVRTVASLREERGSTAAGREGRVLAIEGFEATLKGLQAKIDFVANDRGNIEAATRDARRADRFLRQGAESLRRAGQALGVRVGALNGY
jgi:hypothetical protein